MRNLLLARAVGLLVTLGAAGTANAANPNVPTYSPILSWTFPAPCRTSLRPATRHERMTAMAEEWSKTGRPLLRLVMTASDTDTTQIPRLKNTGYDIRRQDSAYPDIGAPNH
jgi:hypothetical protein